ncbi:hypothetical protein Taro_028057 [Colocasia esculenta]|uniref:TF-B3 domain-containing protein n=1 Tax=Colocasia esculenta TaxID=4460 RepID=A0A843VFI0_COLES|nr:hypothetical protein [Colocasia esculenta]
MKKIIKIIRKEERQSLENKSGLSVIVQDEKGLRYSVILRRSWCGSMYMFSGKGWSKFVENNYVKELDIMKIMSSHYVRRDVFGKLYLGISVINSKPRKSNEKLRYGTWRTESDGFHLRRPRVRVPVHDRDCLPVHAGRPGDRDHLPVDHASSATFPFFLTTRGGEQHPAVDEEGPQLPGRQPCWISGGKIDPGSASRYITTLRRYAFTRLEDLPRARAIWESTAQTNLRKSMWEARDKAIKTTGNRDPMAWLDYGPIWLRRDY